MTTNSSVVVLIPSGRQPEPATCWSLANLCCAGLIQRVEPITGMWVSDARNALTRWFLSTQATHALYLDDDMAFNADLVHRLLACQQDMVSALYFARVPPHYPAAYLKSPDENPYRHYPLRQWSGGLEEIDMCGFGAVLVHRRIVEKMTEPWFCHRDGEHGEDVYFCVKAKATGTRIFLDSSTQVAHCAGSRMITSADYLAHNSAVSHTFMGV